MVEVDLPGVDNFRDIKLSYVGSVLDIRVPGKYIADIPIPGRKNFGAKAIFSSRRQMLTITIPML